MLLRKTDPNNPSDWFDLAEDRLRLADLGWDDEGITPSGVEMLQQSVERYLKGFLVAKGWKLEKTHDLETLIAAGAQIDGKFASFMNFADILTEDFFAQHYPGGDLTSLRRDYEAIRATVGELIKLIQTSLPQFFPTS